MASDRDRCVVAWMTVEPSVQSSAGTCASLRSPSTPRRGAEIETRLNVVLDPS